MKANIDAAILSKTRAEEHDADIWGEFFIPPYFERLGLKTATKSNYIVGKRGCGKTMLLKYFDYHTAFSARRPSIPDDEITHIGVYWRVDTQFCSSLQHRGIAEDQWQIVFESYFSLYVGIEIIRSLKAVASSAYRDFSMEDFDRLSFDSAPDFDESFPASAAQLELHLGKVRRSFSTWVSNVATVKQPLLPPGRVFLESLIEDIRKTPKLSQASFYIYVDEIENLVPYQRRVLNTLLKHSQKPLIVNFTSKERSQENQTTGPEWVNGTHDYRLLDLDQLLSESERPLFFSEVFLANLDLAAGEHESVLVRRLQSLDLISERRDPQYREAILSDMRSRFPSKTYKEFAMEALSIDAIKRKLEERIGRSLKYRGSKVDSREFMSFDSAPEALVVVPALLNRPGLAPEQVLSALREYVGTGGGQFSTSWVQNNLVGALLEIYRPYGRECPLYSGFDTLCTMSNNNLRNFLILCYKALEIADLKDEGGVSISIETQSRAAYEAADQLIREIKTFGQFGEQLRIFVLRLGSIFRALQATPTMSEPEQNQFTINSGQRALNNEELRFLGEAMKYAILVEQLETKTKGAVGSDIIDYQLNPIYSPYFQISYRRKRKLEISTSEFQVLFSGNEDEYRSLARSVSKATPEIDDRQLGLI
ncbi:hypothetical protein [Pseudomonas aeruginosa]|uniref:ORC-CDC6 family AAA ATPase n=1 Tax=Pseudomonas aeruginosa TaxID=287 RepID=UPI002359F6F5|nr:hypothetical protein [Pseudomonas aeruginosa]MDY1450491.1 hypothetical protein [Pseudomonas aeruginosa]HEJ2935017.1 hypothetical protein [Pseudomonas aeruginosa]